MAPVAIRAAPAERENSVEEFFDLRSRAIAQSTEIGNQTGVPKEHRYREVSRDCKDVPKERTAKVGPDRVLIRNWREEPSHPNAPDVDAGKNRGANNREERHRFG